MKFDRVPCPLCFSQNSKTVYSSIPAPEDRSINITVVKCTACGLLYQNPRPRLEKFIHEKTERSGFSVDGKNPRYESRLRVLESLAEKGAILDIGCGYGEFLFAAKHRGWAPYGIEPSIERSAFAKKHGIKVFRGYLRQLRLPREKFSVITMLDVLEHLPEPHKEIKECARVLKNDGILVIRTPLADSLYSKIKGKNWYYGLEHLAYYGISTTKRLMNENGFTAEKIFYGDEMPAKTFSDALRKIHLGPLHLASATIYFRKVSRK